MAEKKAIGCARPVGGVEPDASKNDTSEKKVTENSYKEKKMIQVGRKAPDFVSPAFYNGDFTSVKLSDFLGKWVVLCFYPGDFTFV